MAPSGARAPCLASAMGDSAGLHSPPGGGGCERILGLLGGRSPGQFLDEGGMWALLCSLSCQCFWTVQKTRRTILGKQGLDSFGRTVRRGSGNRNPVSKTE